MFRGYEAQANLIDISLGGMAVHYVPACSDLPDSALCDLITASKESALPRALACRVVYDIADLAEGRSFRGSATRRRGFRFSRLEEEQKHEVELLIRRSGAAP
jgi:c-di-GMP-binding flagellar brake protein YcgR